MDSPAIAYLTTRYPAVSHSFIQREVLALRRRGVAIDTYAIRRCDASDVLSPEDREAAATTFAALPISPPRLVAVHLRALATAPRGYLRALRTALGLAGARRALLHFAEAVPIWLAARARGTTHVHAHFTSPSADVALLVAALGDGGGPWRYSFTAHGTDITTDVPARLAAKVRAADTVVCVSDLGRAQLMMLVEEEHWDKLAVVRCGVDLDAFAPPAAPRGDEGPLRVLCVGRLAPEKGQQVLVDAAAESRAAGVDVAVTFVGAGPKLESLQRRAAERGLSDHVTFTGAVGQDRIAELYAAADVFCLPSFGEGVPVVLMEAMATGLPVVATSVGGVPELVEHGVTGLLVRPGRAEPLAEALVRLARDPALRARFSGLARARVEEEFELEHTADRLRAVLRGQDPVRVPEPAVA